MTAFVDDDQSTQSRSVLAGELMAIYPRQERRISGMRAAETLLRSGAVFDDVLLATESYARVREGEPQQYTKLAENFFGDGTWGDYLPGGVGLTKASKANVNFLVQEASAALERFFLTSPPRDTSILPPLARRAIDELLGVGRMKTFDLRAALRALALKAASASTSTPAAIIPATPTAIDEDSDLDLSDEIAAQFRCDLADARA